MFYKTQPNTIFIFQNINLLVCKILMIIVFYFNANNIIRLFQYSKKTIKYFGAYNSVYINDFYLYFNFVFFYEPFINFSFIFLYKMLF